MDENITIIINFISINKRIDVQVPIWITANEFVVGLNEAYNLGIDISNYSKCYLKSENPIAFIRGNKKLKEFGLRNGSIINIV